MVSDLSLLSVLKTTMRWHQTRQTVLAENVANADSANFHARDLKPLDFESLMQSGKAAGAGQMSATQAGHIAVGSSDGRFATTRTSGLETTPDGNGVTLEDQMMKLSQNELNYQAATTLYARALNLVKTALSRGN